MKNRIYKSKSFQPYRITVKRNNMKKIEFVGGIAPELADVIDENSITVICNEDMTCNISDDDFAKLKSVAPAAFDGNDIVIVED